MSAGGFSGKPNVPHAGRAIGVYGADSLYELNQQSRWPGDFPKTISGLQLWFAAHRLTGLANDDPVSTWPDLSGNGYDVSQATSANKPVYKTNVFNDMPALYFDGVNDGLENTVNNPFTAGAARTVFVAAKCDASTGVFICFRRSAAVWCYQFLDNPSWPGLFFTDGANGASNTWSKTEYAVQGAMAILCIRAPGAGGQHKLRVNGYNATIGGGATPNSESGSSGFYVGRREGSNGFHKGHIAEIIAYSGELSDADCLQIERYLTAIYALR